MFSAPAIWYSVGVRGNCPSAKTTDQMKTYTFLVCLTNGSAEFADIVALNSAEAVRALVAKFGKVRANIINIY